MALCSGLSADSDGVRLESESMLIQSRESIIDLKSGRRHHEGNVRVRHLNFRLWSEDLDEFRRNGVLVRVAAKGSPARIRQLPPFSENLSHGVALRAEYRPLERKLTLWDYTVTDIDGNIMKGKKAVYLLQ